MKIWEGTDLVCCYNIEGEEQLRRIRLVHLPEKVDPEEVSKFATLFLTVLPSTHSEDSVQIINRTRYI